MTTRTTELAAGAQHAGFWRTPGPARLALGLVLTILLLKLPTATISLLLPEGYGTLVPASGGGKEVWISLSWIVFTLVAVGARHWIGAVSAIWLLTLSAISGGRLLADSYLAWGLWLMASSLVGLMALALALRAGGFSRKRRSADGRRPAPSRPVRSGPATLPPDHCGSGDVGEKTPRMRLSDVWGSDRIRLMSNEAMQVRALRGRVVTPDHIIDDGAVVLSGAHIAWVGPADQAARAGFADAVEQAQAAPEGGYLLPGLVDVHCHGGGGESFPNAETAEQAMISVREHRRFGTTSLVASCVTAAPEVLKARTRVLAGLCEDGELAGIHFEGPFVSVERCGAQDPTYIIDPDAALTRELIELGGGHVVTMTIAPEKPGITGDDGVNAALIEGGALPSFGHTDSEAAPVRAALADAAARIAERIEAGKTVRSPRSTATHLFNGMRPMHHRKPGPVPEFLAAAQRGECVLEMIGDGVHLNPAIVLDMFETLGRDNVVLITDAMAAAGMVDGDYVLGSQPVTVADGVARLTEGGAIAGGTAHLIDVVRTTWHGGVDLVDAVYAASVQGAQILGDPYVGALRAGLWADVVVTDADLRPVTVLRRGETVEPAA